MIYLCVGPRKNGGVNVVTSDTFPSLMAIALMVVTPSSGSNSPSYNLLLAVGWVPSSV